jgi:hypothetical protein
MPLFKKKYEQLVHLSETTYIIHYIKATKSGVSVNTKMTAFGAH